MIETLEQPTARRPPFTSRQQASETFAYVEFTYHQASRIHPANGQRVRVGPLPGEGAIDAARDAARWPHARDIEIVVSPWPLATGWFVSQEAAKEDMMYPDG